MSTILVGDLTAYAAGVIDNTSAVFHEPFMASGSGTAQILYVGHTVVGNIAIGGIWDAAGTTLLAQSSPTTAAAGAVNGNNGFAFDVSAANLPIVAGNVYRIAIMMAAANPYFRPYQGVAGTQAPATDRIHGCAATYPTWPGSLANTTANFGTDNAQMYVMGASNVLVPDYAGIIARVQRS